MKIRKIKLFTTEYFKSKKLYEENFPKYDRFPFFLLWLQSIRASVELNEIWDEDFVGFYFTVRNSKVIFLMYLAIDHNLRSKGYGSKVIEFIKSKYSNLNIVLNTEILDENAIDNQDRKLRFKFYERNSIFDTGYGYILNDQWYAVLSSDLKSFNPKEYEKIVRKFSLGLYNEYLSKRL